MNVALHQDGEDRAGSTSDTAALERTSVTYEQVGSPFQKAIAALVAEKGEHCFTLQKWPTSGGLQGRVAVNRTGILDHFIAEQFDAFWHSLPESQQAVFVRKRTGWSHLFSEAAYSIFSAILMNAVVHGSIPHPDKKRAGTERAGRIGSLEDDCARALGSIRCQLAKVLATHLEHYSSGEIKDDQALIHSMSDYLGLGLDMDELLQARVLDHHDQPNTFKADNYYGACLTTALGQCFGISIPFQRTTPEEVIADQMIEHEWPEAYRRTPLLDAVLQDSFSFYDPERVAASYADMVQLIPDDVSQEEAIERVQEARIITDALLSFRRKLVGEEGTSSGQDVNGEHKNGKSGLVIDA